MHRELPNLYLFAKVAETLSFRDTAEELHLARSTVSKRIARFEKELGVKLFNRSTRSMSLTDAGQRLYQHWHTVEKSIHSALTDVKDADQRLSGTLRVSVPSSLGAVLMPSLINEFRPLYPEIELNVAFSEQYVDLVRHGYDVVIHVAEQLPDSRLIAKKLATSPKVLAASPRYIERFGQPKKLEDLGSHHCLALENRSNKKVRWSFDSSDGPVNITIKPIFAANNDLALVLAACLDAGIIYKQQIFIESELHFNRLKVIKLADCKGPRCGLFAVYPNGNPSAKVKVFVDFVKEQLSVLSSVDRWAPLKTVGDN